MLHLANLQLETRSTEQAQKSLQFRLLISFDPGSEALPSQWRELVIENLEKEELPEHAQVEVIIGCGRVLGAGRQGSPGGGGLKQATFGERSSTTR